MPKTHVLQPYFSRLKACVRRLNDSEGRRVARRNARRAALAQVNALKEFVNTHWPALDQDGRELRPARRAPKCPICDLRCGTWVGVARHMNMVHKLPSCPCNKTGGKFGHLGYTIYRYARHLASTKDLKAHVGLCLIGRVGQ